MSCHCRVKYMANDGFSSAPFRYGRTEGGKLMILTITTDTEQRWETS